MTFGICELRLVDTGCVFLKLGESMYMAMDLIPILLGSLPLAHIPANHPGISGIIPELQAMSLCPDFVSKIPDFDRPYTCIIIIIIIIQR